MLDVRGRHSCARNCDEYEYVDVPKMFVHTWPLPHWLLNKNKLVSLSPSFSFSFYYTHFLFFVFFLWGNAQKKWITITESYRRQPVSSRHRERQKTSAPPLWMAFMYRNAIAPRDSYRCWKRQQRKKERIFAFRLLFGCVVGGALSASYFTVRTTSNWAVSLRHERKKQNCFYACTSIHHS